MAQANKYDFGSSFDPGAAEEDLRVAAKHTDDDLEAARRQAYDEGHAVGLALATQSEERRLVEIMTTIAGQADNLAAEFQTHIADHSSQAHQMGMLVCRKVLPTIAQRNGLAEIEGLISECLNNLPNEPRLVVRVDETTLPKLQAHIDKITTSAGSFSGNVVLLADDDLASTDCQVLWADGGAERDIGKLMEHIDEVVDRHLNISQPALDQADPAAPTDPTTKRNQVTEENNDASQAPTDPVDAASI